MKKEDIEFLRELQQELKNQDSDGQAEPKYWGIIEDHGEMTHNGEGEPYIIEDGEGMSFDYFKESIEETIQESNSDIQEQWKYIDKDDADEVVDFMNDNFPDTTYSLVWIKNTRQLSTQTGCFLTKRSAIAHLKANSYHYNNGHTYAMTAWRNPEFEHLIKILQSMNIDDIKQD